jgi:peptide-methionine (S)-S-oxide reductase
VSYERLLEVFWENHEPTSLSSSRQYMSIIFVHNKGQRSLAAASKEREAKKRKGKIFTEIITYSKFYFAEGYHQKYYLQGQQDLVKEVRAIYPSDTDFFNSTAAARMNGYAAGYGTPRDLEAEIERLGLSRQGTARLREIVK